MVIWSDAAIDDLNSVFDYIAVDSRYYAFVHGARDLLSDQFKDLLE